MKRIAAVSLTPSSIYCVGKNYQLHAEEMLRWESEEEEIGKKAEKPEEPIIFLKPSSSLSSNKKTSIPLYRGKPISNNMHYEAELVVLIGRDADNVTEENALSCVAGYGIGLDMTLRDVQMDAKGRGEPWLKSKGFKNSSLVSDFIPADHIPDPAMLAFELRLNDTIVQKGETEKMLFDIPVLISYLSYIYGLQSGDLLFTGTPEGVGRVEHGDTLSAQLFLNSQSGPELLTVLDATVEK
ncbi:MAG: FAA hydrolase family protein [Prosthecochloris sp.]|nr:FAA hydrolase family protein [Prosthecochloris sp.]